MATQSRILAWRIPWMEEPGEPQSMGLQRVQHDWATNTSTFFLSCNSTAQSRHGFRQLWLPSHLGLGVFLEFSFSRPTASFGKSCWLYLQSESESEVAQSCPTLCDPWTVAHQAPLSMGFSRQEYWSGLPFPSPGDLPDPGIEPRSPTLQADALTSAPPGKPPCIPNLVISYYLNCCHCGLSLPLSPGLPLHWTSSSTLAVLIPSQFSTQQPDGSS